MSEHYSNGLRGFLDCARKDIVLVCGWYLLTREEALKAEEKLAWDLRRDGYTVWFN